MVLGGWRWIDCDRLPKIQKSPRALRDLVRRRQQVAHRSAAMLQWRSGHLEIYPKGKLLLLNPQLSANLC